jgi:hypothetical protein
LSIEGSVSRVIALIGRHIIVGQLARNFGLDGQKIADGLNHSLCNIPDVSSEMLGKAVKKIPRAGPNSDMIVMNQTNKMLQDLRDEPGLILEERTVTDTNFHIL